MSTFVRLGEDHFAYLVDRGPAPTQEKVRQWQNLFKMWWPEKKLLILEGDFEDLTGQYMIIRKDLAEEVRRLEEG